MKKWLICLLAALLLTLPAGAEEPLVRDETWFYPMLYVPGSRMHLLTDAQLETIAQEFAGVESCFALQAGREVRVIVSPEKVSEGEAQMLARDICQKIEHEMNYPGQIKVHLVRESRAVDYAK